MLTTAALWASATTFASPPSPVAVESGETQERVAMRTLATWGAGNLLLGAVTSQLSEDAEWQAFHQMNAGWGAVNLGLAATGLLPKRREVDPAKQKQRWLNFPAVFAFNAGLDVGYVGTGIWLIHQGVEYDDSQQKGWGKSLILQGSALFVFDVVMAMRFSKINRELWLQPHQDGLALNGRF